MVLIFKRWKWKPLGALELENRPYPTDWFPFDGKDPSAVDDSGPIERRKKAGIGFVSVKGLDLRPRKSQQATTALPWSKTSSLFPGRSFKKSAMPVWLTLPFLSISFEGSCLGKDYNEWVIVICSWSLELNLSFVLISSFSLSTNLT